MCRRSWCLLLFAPLTAPAASAAPIPKQVRTAITAENADRVCSLGELSFDVWEMAWGPKPGEISFLAWEKPIEVLDAVTFKPVRQIAPDKKLVHFAIAPGGGALAWSENSTGVELHDPAKGKSVMIETKSAQPSINFAPDGKLLAVTSGKEVKLCKVPSGKLVRILDGGAEGGLTPVFSPDGAILAVGNRNDTTRLYETTTGKLLHELPRQMTQGLGFSPNGRTLAATYVDGTVGLWDVATGKLLREKASGAKELYTLDWSPKGDVLATAGREGRITLWEPQELKALKELDAPPWVIKVRFSPGGYELFTAGGGEASGPERKVVIWGLKHR